MIRKIFDKFFNKTGKFIENGDTFWYKNRKIHRIDGPAVECANGTKFWYYNNKCHRKDGPAVEWFDGEKWWFIKGKRYSEEEYNKYFEKEKD